MLGRGAPALLLVVLVAACLEALPPPIECEAPSKVIDGECVSCAEPLVFVGESCVECPPAAQVPNKSCLETLNALPVMGDGCIGETENGFSCLAGDPPDCACDPEDCSEELTCYGDSSCPPEVLEAEPNARCLSLGEDQWSWFAYPNPAADHDSTDCVCGCMRCATQCDGKGTIFGVYDDDAAPYTRTLQGPAIDLRGMLPSSGKLGFYVRGRGWASIAALVTKDLTLSTIDTAYFLPLLNDFSQPIAYSPDDEGARVECPQCPGGEYPRPYAWSSEAEAPTHMLFIMTTASDTGGFPSSGIVEIDCVIPFVTDE
ncbi:MAG: hypothetical protein HOV80_36065 [Polyangiaceae bacterium]|nr:hypothetical protein [Polyangiaceae bacterium]